MTASRPQVAAATFVIGCALVLLIEEPLARIVGVPLMFAGILLGVAAIATPEFLAAEDDDRTGASGRGGEPPPA